MQLPNTDSSNIEPAPQQISDTNMGPTPLEEAQTKLLTWWNELNEGSLKNREQDINKELVLQLQNAAKATKSPQKEIVLFHQHSFSGYRFFYAGTGKDEYLPMDWDVGCLLYRADRCNITLPWTITDRQTGTRVIVQVKRCEAYPEPPSAS